MVKTKITSKPPILYWSSVEPTTDGVLGGIGEISPADLQASRSFITRVAAEEGILHKDHPTAVAAGSTGGDGFGGAMPPFFRNALDCGAGIGRITQGFLADVAAVVDAVEPVHTLARVMYESDGFAGLRQSGRLGRVWECGLERWPPCAVEAGGAGGAVKQVPWRSEGDRRAEVGAEEDRVGNGDGEDGTKRRKKKMTAEAAVRSYDLVWVQWCSGYLSDGQYESLLRRMSGHGRQHSGTEAGSGGSGGVLAPGGIVVVKENVSTTVSAAGEPVDDFSRADSSVTRSRAKFVDLFGRAGFRVVREEVQAGFPDGLYPVRMWALRRASEV